VREVVQLRVGQQPEGEQRAREGRVHVAGGELDEGGEGEGELGEFLVEVGVGFEGLGVGLGLRGGLGLGFGEAAGEEGALGGDGGGGGHDGGGFLGSGSGSGSGWGRGQVVRRGVGLLRVWVFHLVCVVCCLGCPW
jgi:hypothetical protein